MIDPKKQGRGGAAWADASAIGLGSADATALAVGGNGRFDGSATAVARAEGATGFAQAEAISPGGPGESYGALTRIDVGSVSNALAESFAQAAALPAFAMSQDIESYAFVTSHVFQADVALARSANAGIDAAIAGDQGMQALGHFSTASPTGAHGSVSEFDLLLDPGTLLQDVSLGVFGIDAVGDGFSELRFRIELSGGVVLVGEQVFTTLADAQTYFADTVFDIGDLGDATPQGPGLLVVFETSLDAGDQIGISFGLMALPEPSTGLLLVMALLVGVRVRRR